MEPSIYCGLILTLMIPRGRDSETGTKEAKGSPRVTCSCSCSVVGFLLFFLLLLLLLLLLHSPFTSSRPDGSSNQDRTTSRVSLRAAPLPGIRMYVRKENQHFLWCGRQAGDTTVISTRTAACVECVSRCENGAATAGVSE
jgi:hypothetical protein